MNENQIGARIAALRQSRDESQQAVADSIGVKRETVKFWESGDRQIKAGDLIKLAQHFKVSADYILGLTEVEAPSTDVRSVCEYTGLSAENVTRLHNAYKGSGFLPMVNFVFNSVGFWDFLFYLYEFEMSVAAETIYRRLSKQCRLDEETYESLSPNEFEAATKLFAQKFDYIMSCESVSKQIKEKLQRHHILWSVSEPYPSELQHLGIAPYLESDLDRLQMDRDIKRLIDEITKESIEEAEAILWHPHA